MKKNCKLFFSVGEASGDILAADLINSLKKYQNYKFQFYGVAGKKMIDEEGMKSLFPNDELSITGYLEVIPKIFKIIFRLFQTFFYIKKIKPDLIITVDSPGFNFPLVKLVRRFLKLNIPIIHYVAPTVWAYKPERAKKCAKLFDHMVVIFPFEKQFFDNVGLKCSYVGNHTINNNSFLDVSKKQSIKEKYGLTNNKVITILPGSRNNELKYHLPVIKQYILEMTKNINNVFFVIPTLKHLENEIKKKLPFENVLITKKDNEKKELINISNLILCKSGTSVLESIAKKIPIIVFYKMNTLTAHFIKKKLKIKYVTICNIMMNKMVIPELLQDNFHLDSLLEESRSLIDDSQKITQQLNNFDLFLSKFSSTNVKQQKVSEVVVKCLENFHN